jgi:hypothetical protein
MNAYIQPRAGTAGTVVSQMDQKQLQADPEQA